MDVAALTAATGTAAGATSAATDRAMIADNFDSFLQLLVTQLQNQNPLEPLDTHQFTQQLVQFASVEQEIKANDNLTSLTELMAAQAAMATVGYLGSTVTAASATTQLRDGEAAWSFSTAKDAAEATITVRNAAGTAVFSEKTTLSAGRDTYRWPGRGNDGQSLPEGNYTLTIDARDAAGNAIQVDTQITGKVDGIDYSGLEPMLLVSGLRVPLAAVTSVSAPVP